MADASYDAVVIGGGLNGVELILADIECHSGTSSAAEEIAHDWYLIVFDSLKKHCFSFPLHYIPYGRCYLMPRR